MQSKLIQIFETKKKYFLDSGPQFPGKEKNYRKRKTKVIEKKAKRLVITEIKRSSPSLGEINRDTDILTIAGIYQEAGASAISVLTEENYFSGSLEFLSQVRERVDLPILRKDFIFDTRQVKEAKAWGADGILLIISYLSKSGLRELVKCAHDEGMWILAESHSLEETLELVEVRELNPVRDFLGINNRNLHTLEIKKDHSRRVIKHLLDHGYKREMRIIAESGFEVAKDLDSYGGYADGFLIGSSLMKIKDSNQMKKRVLELTGKLSFC